MLRRRVRPFDVAHLEVNAREEEMLAYRVICDGFEASARSGAQTVSYNYGMRLEWDFANQIKDQCI